MAHTSKDFGFELELVSRPYNKKHTIEQVYLFYENKGVVSVGVIKTGELCISELALDRHHMRLSADSNAHPYAI